jgi:hypothetical protein
MRRAVAIGVGVVLGVVVGFWAPIFYSGVILGNKRDFGIGLVSVYFGAPLGAVLGATAGAALGGLGRPGPPGKS